ncbi:hypothetical protein LS684_17295 [Cytobacillus spongiae]|uniref:hypothetical protein n=1 Tax=Cytobacillus spongiae TaxID=2901381 RepID=UPI001F404B46|nr:hypothetical protein [Cytobacillus spongiae]UII55368.1 hypothetical protein LS684_17295 [Cytobacillus spongiae]
MRKKIIASMSIFLLLLTGGYVIEQKDKREFYVPTVDEEIVEILPVNYMDKQKKRYKFFESREYVRIETI